MTTSKDFLMLHDMDHADLSDFIKTEKPEWLDGKTPIYIHDGYDEDSNTLFCCIAICNEPFEPHEFVKWYEKNSPFSGSKETNNVS